MSNAARRVLELFLQPPMRGVTGVTGVTRAFVTPGNPMVTPDTPVTCQKQLSTVETERRTHTIEHDDNLIWPRIGAEALAFEASVIQWLNRNAAPSPAGRCAWCGQLESDGPGIVPFGTEPGSHAWLHGECWRPWHQARRDEAVKAIRRIGNLADAAPSART
jgi:hypothetical protein